MPDPLITAKQVTYIYPNNSVGLDNIDLEIYPGEIISVVGGSGAGKTTLILVLSGILKPTRGYVNIRSGRLGVLLQNYDDMLIFPTVKDEIMDIASSIYRDSLGDHKIIESEIIERFSLKNLIHKRIYELSAGERKRIVLSIVFSRRPDIALLDEPLTDLDNLGREILIREIKDIKMRKGAVLVVSNEIIFPREISDTICIINRGRIIKCFDPVETCRYRELLHENNIRVPSKEICC
ncbi:MAG: energy-coupling factor ABC transporter ATP-binding protein [Sulfolobales archaeon]